MKKGLILLTAMLLLALPTMGCGASSTTIGTSETTSETDAISTALVSTNTAQLSDVSSGIGYVNILVTDAPPRNEVTSIMVTVSGISVHKAVAANIATSPTTSGATASQYEAQEREDQWITIPITGPNPFDLLQLQGIDEILGTAGLEAGRYTQIRLEIEAVEVALDGGPLQAATVPSNELKFVRPFDIVEGETTDIELDFDAQKSVHITGSDKIMVKPVVKITITIKSSDNVETVTGEVIATDTQTSTISIIPEGETEPVDLTITPQTIIVLDGEEVELAELAALPSGITATASYHPENMHAIRIEIITPQTVPSTTDST